MDKDTKCCGDDDPVDVCEIGTQVVQHTPEWFPHIISQLTYPLAWSVGVFARSGHPSESVGHLGHDR